MFGRVVLSKIQFLIKNIGYFNMLLNPNEDNKDIKDVGMEEELNSAKKKLQETTEKYDTLTGELKILNKKLHSSNGQLSNINLHLQTQINDVQNLLENANIAIIFLDKQLVIKNFSQPVKRLLNLNNRDLGCKISSLNTNLQYNSFLSDVEFVLSSLEPKDIDVQTKDGSWFLMRITPYKTITNTLDGIVVNFIDIDDRKKFEQMEAEKELLRVNRLKSEIMRRTSHELKTPLISIKGFSDLLLTVHHEKLDEDIISIIEEIKEGSLRLEDLIENILIASELDSNTVKLKKKEEDLVFLIRYCVNRMKGLANLRNQSIIIDIQDIIKIEIEKEHIYEVLDSLILNAINYTPPNGIIRIETEEKEGFIVVSINDNGIGFTEEEKLTIFKQFGKIERFGQGLEVKSGGTGIGLYISKKIIELHGGKIWVESSGRNKGSTFYFSLPISNKTLLNIPY